MNFTRIPIFLAPAFANATSLPVCLSIRAFSASACHEARHKNPRKGNRDSNKQRGVSAMRSTGLRHPLMAQKKYKTLPEPRDLKEQQTEAENDIPHSKNHGLLGFFEKSKDNVQVVLNTEVEEAVGRSWSIDELQFKSFNDLHALHWKCLYEMNRIKTRIREVGRLKTEDTRRATSRRFDWVKKTMNNIRAVLLVRQKAYEQAQVLVSQKSFTEIDKFLESQEREQEGVVTIQRAEKQNWSHTVSA